MNILRKEWFYNLKKIVPLIKINSQKDHFILLRYFQSAQIYSPFTYASKLCWFNDPIHVFFSTCTIQSAGHSKWQNIKHIKAAKDKERGDVFQRLSKLIQLATKEPGGINPALNSKLARVIGEAKNAKMPQTTIDRALNLAQTQSKNAKPHTVGMVGTGGIYLLIDVVTDKLIRTRQTLISMCKKLGLREERLTLSAMYEEKGVIITTGSESALSTAMDHAIECGAEDVTYDEGYFTFLCGPYDFTKVKTSLEELKYTIEYADIDKLPNVFSAIKESDAAAFKTLIAKIEAHDEVSRVQINFDL